MMAHVWLVAIATTITTSAADAALNGRGNAACVGYKVSGAGTPGE
jgi:hypothetical protein